MGSSRLRRAQLGAVVFCGRALLIFYGFLVSSSSVSAQQVQTDFCLQTLNSSSMECTGASNLTPHLEDVRQAACLTPFLPTTSNSSLADIAGRCSYLNPIGFSASRSFSTMFSFNTLKYPTYNPGEGFTFFLSPEKPGNASDATGGFLGWINESTNGDASGNNFAVEFDLVQNTTAGIADPPQDHVGVNVNNLNSTFFTTFDPDYLTTLSSTATLFAWVDYDGGRKWISVSLSQNGQKPCKTIISGSLDLSGVLLDKMYLGFSSSTGGGTVNVTQYNTQTTVWDWSFNTNGMATNIYGDNENCGVKVSSSLILGIVVGVLSVLLLVMLGVILLLHFRSRKVSDLEEEKALLVAELEQLDFGARPFTYQEIVEATRDFREPIGEGGFGTVYKGNLSNLSSHKGSDTLVAVKRIKNTADSADDAKQLVAEVKVIGRLRHVNIVPVLGWCYERGQMLLVYKYMENGDLDQQIFPYDYGIKGAPTLSWVKRVGIIRGVASALRFLHEDFESEQTVLHRDIKTRNVMIDRTFNARLGDFGLARFCDRMTGHQSTQLIGTRGYMAPEYMSTGASGQTDVYSFGVLALVVATGRKPVGKNIPSHGSLVQWVRELYDEGRITDAGDFMLLDNDPSLNMQELERVLTVGLFCCLFEPQHRPAMCDVVNALQGTYTFSWTMPEYPDPEPLEFPATDYDDITQPFEDYKKDEYYTAQQAMIPTKDAKVDIDK